MTVPPGDDEWKEEYPPADTGFRSVYIPDDYDEEWGTFRPDDEDWEAEFYRRQIPEFNCHYDIPTRSWVCDCEKFISKGACHHVYKYRDEETIRVSKDYL